MSAKNDIEKMQGAFGERVVGSHEFRGEHTIVVTPDGLHEVLTMARDACGYEMLLDVSSVDHLGREPRFEVVYELATVDDQKHLRVKVPVAEGVSLATATDIWKSADWHEREVYDLMGISFSGHPDLRRILMWEGYPFHPLRKDFPLAGRATEMPDVAFTDVAPMEGGPFVTTSGAPDPVRREPRSRDMK